MKKDHTEVIVSNIFYFLKKVVKRPIESPYAVHRAWYRLHKVLRYLLLKLRYTSLQDGDQESQIKQLGSGYYKL